MEKTCLHSLIQLRGYGRNSIKYEAMARENKVKKQNKKRESPSPPPPPRSDSLHPYRS